LAWDLIERTKRGHALKREKCDRKDSSKFSFKGLPLSSLFELDQARFCLAVESIFPTSTTTWLKIFIEKEMACNSQKGLARSHLLY
jgi:hypothetical protein